MKALKITLALSLLVFPRITLANESTALANDRNEDLRRYESIIFDEEFDLGVNLKDEDSPIRVLIAEKVNLKELENAECHLTIDSVPPMTQNVVRKGREFKIRLKRVSGPYTTYVELLDSANRAVGSIVCGHDSWGFEISRSILERILPVKVINKNLKRHEVNYEATPVIRSSSAAT